jgi:hypothetical protein
MPFTGASGLSLAAALAALGTGILALGLSRLRKVNARS